MQVIFSHTDSQFNNLINETLPWYNLHESDEGDSFCTDWELKVSCRRTRCTTRDQKSTDSPMAATSSYPDTTARQAGAQQHGRRPAD